MIPKGSLWDRIQDVTAAALRSGALLPIPTDCEFIEEAGVRFLVRVVSSLRRKDEEKKRGAAAGTGERRNPFLPPDADLLIGGITETHSAVLNKFNVMDNHLLIITNEFEDQEMLLTRRDFDALALCMDEYDGLGFYNGGEAAGASQRHKHLQLIPLPISSGGPAVPIEPLFMEARYDGKFGTLPAFPFRHEFMRLDLEAATSPEEVSQAMLRCYRDLLGRNGLGPSEGGEAEKQRGPYCLLATRQWMLLVPRTKEFCGSISINSLGYAGSFFVRSAEELAKLRETGPIAVLQDVAVSSDLI